MPYTLILSLTILQLTAPSTRADPNIPYANVLDHPNLHLLPRPTACGKVLADIIVHYVVNGKSASKGQYPWLALLFKHDHHKNKLDPYCGGSIINSRYILTAAHCCVSNMISVQLGDVLLKRHQQVCTGNRSQYGRCKLPSDHYRIERFISHNYNGQSKQNDICLVRLTRLIRFNVMTQPICLPVDPRIASQDLRYKLVEVAGWGQIDPDIYKQSKLLQTARIPIIPQERCHLIHKVADQNLCAGTPREGACRGDSGGPLMYEFPVGKQFRYFLIGIVSWGDEVCVRGSPTVFTRVSFFMKWILDNLRR